MTPLFDHRKVVTDPEFCALAPMAQLLFIHLVIRFGPDHAGLVTVSSETLCEIARFIRHEGNLVEELQELRAAGFLPAA